MQFKMPYKLFKLLTVELSVFCSLPVSASPSVKKREFNRITKDELFFCSQRCLTRTDAHTIAHNANSTASEAQRLRNEAVGMFSITDQEAVQGGLGAGGRWRGGGGGTSSAQKMCCPQRREKT